MERMGFAAAGLRHGHIFGVIKTLSARDDMEFLGAWEENADARAAAEAAGVSCVYPTFDALLADPRVRVVAVGDAYGRRGPLVLKALRAGRHVISDKPLCTDPATLEAIGAEASARDLAVGIALDLRDHPNMVTAADAVKKGLLGKVNNILFEGQHPLNYGTRPSWYFEEGMHGGTVNDIAIHGIDYCRQITGAKLERVVGARAWNFYAKEVPFFKDSAQLMLKLEGGIGVLADVSYAAPDTQGYAHPSYWHVRVFGEKGYLDFSYGSEGVKACLNGETSCRVLPRVTPEDTWDGRFAAALADSAARARYTADMLTTQRETLTVQAAADAEEE